MKRRKRPGRWLSAVVLLVYLSAGGLYLMCWDQQPAPEEGPSAGAPAADSPLYTVELPRETASAVLPPKEEAELPEALSSREEPAAEAMEPESPLPLLHDPVQVTGHRGDSVHFPENTLLAFQGALEKGVDWVELDVQQSSDGELVVFHDESLRRITGQRAKLWKRTWKELEQLDAGAWLNPRFAGTRIPKLSEALAFCKDRIRMNIEIKEDAHALKSPITVRLVKLIEDYGMEDQVVVTAYMRSTLQLIKELNPKIQTALLCDRPGRFYYDAPEVDIFSASASLVTKELVENAHAAGKKVTAWVVDTEESVVRLASYGVDNIMSSNPGETLRYLYGETGYITLIQNVGK